MAGAQDFLVTAVAVGAGATAAMDLGAIALERLVGVARPDYALVGRWVAGLACGRLRHESISTAPPAANERTLGWSVHYLVGIAFAGLLLSICGLEWARAPTPGPALAVGIGTLAAPFLIMQPGMGAGIAASRAPRPGAARLRSLLNHALFGFGLYAAGVAFSFSPLA